MTTGPAEAVEARPWREGDSPAPRMHVYVRGERPMMRIFTEGRWRTCVVQARADWPDRRVAYHVEVPLYRDGAEGQCLRAYWWDSSVMRPAAGRRARPLATNRR